jgi:transketolase
MTKLPLSKLDQIANDIREDIIRMLEHAGSGHSAGPLGLADIFTSLYFEIMKYDPKNPDWDERDILLLSNGHCVPVQYATMAHAGYFDREELMTLRRFGSRLQGHPERARLPGLENTSGPLGSGLSQAAGMALALRMDGNTDRHIYVVMGDGEQDEGNVWEAAMLVGKYRLSNITAITDRNNIQIDGTTESVMPLEDLRLKWEAFGWHVLEVDGNNIEAFIDAVNMAKAITERPVMIIAYTVPGQGVDFMENDYHWHGSPPNHEQAKIALKELRTLGGKIKSEYDD